MLPPGHSFESRADGDLNGDGEADVAFVGRSEDERALYIAFAYRDEFDFGHEIRAKGPLDSWPLGPAELSVARGVLTVEDLTGGTTAAFSTYRLRYDAKRKRMRLIGLDMTNYSRTHAHDGTEYSWNLLTGDTLRRDLKVVAGGGVRQGAGASCETAHEADLSRKPSRRRGGDGLDAGRVTRTRLVTGPENSASFATCSDVSAS